MVSSSTASVHTFIGMRLGYLHVSHAYTDYLLKPFRFFSLQLKYIYLSCLFFTLTERMLEDHEKVLDCLTHWPRGHNNHVLFKNNPEKYYLLKRPQVQTLNQSSLVPRLHPAHARRRGLVSQVQILGLAPEAWSSQSNHRALLE